MTRLRRKKRGFGGRAVGCGEVIRGLDLGRGTPGVRVRDVGKGVRRMGEADSRQFTVDRCERHGQRRERFVTRVPWCGNGGGVCIPPVFAYVGETKELQAWRVYVGETLDLGEFGIGA